jgi:hypothetical protein
LEAVKQSGFDLYEKSIHMLEAAVYHSEEAATKLGPAYSPVVRHSNRDVKTDVAASVRS